MLGLNVEVTAIINLPTLSETARPIIAPKRGYHTEIALLFPRARNS
jgi:hypothetical protein